MVTFAFLPLPPAQFCFLLPRRKGGRKTAKKNTTACKSLPRTCSLFSVSPLCWNVQVAGGQVLQTDGKVTVPPDLTYPQGKGRGCQKKALSGPVQLPRIRTPHRSSPRTRLPAGVQTAPQSHRIPAQGPGKCGGGETQPLEAWLT